MKTFEKSRNQKYAKNILASQIAMAITSTFASTFILAAEYQTLEPIVVHANKLRPVKISSNPTQADTASLLANQSGFSLYNAGGISSLPVIQGLANDRLRTKVDGMDLISSCPNQMNPPLSYINPEQVSAARVYTGVVPVSLGGDSIGGTIVVESNRPTFATSSHIETSAELGASIQSNNNAQALTTKAQLKTENFSIIYSGGQRSADNYKAGGDFKTYTATGRANQTLALNEVGSTAYKVMDHALDMAWKNDHHLFEAKLGYQDVPYENYPNQRMDMLENKEARINLRYSGDYTWGKLESQIWHEKVTHFMNFGDDKQYVYGNALGMPMSTKGKTDGFTLKANIPLTTHDTLKVGTELLHYTLNDWWSASGTGGMGPNTFLNINSGHRDRNALFAELESTLNPEWQTIAGLRYEQVKSDADAVHGYSQTNGMGMMKSNQLLDSTAFNAIDRAKTDNNFDASLLARYQANLNHNIEFGYTHKVRSPNLYERYVWSTWGMAAIMNNTVGDGNGYVGDINLKPEQANTLSLTWNWHDPDGTTSFKATSYYTRVENYIDAVKTSGWAADQFNVLQYANQSAELYGLDLNGQIQLAQNNWGTFGLQGIVGYIHGKNRDTDDGLYNMMPLHSKLSLTHTVANWKNTLEWLAVAAKTNTSDVRNELATSGYGLLNLHSSYAWSKVTLNVGVENVLNRNYGLPLGGVYVGQGGTMATNSTTYNWRLPVPGIGRTFYTGVNMKF